MRHGSLFSGIGGFDYAAELMGWQNIFHCEWNEFGQKVLKYYWPQAISYNDIKKTDFTPHRGAIDILTGGFPCQPYSQAGKRKGKADDRHLWPEMLRAIREIQPSWVVGENVRGLINWNGGVVFDEVQADLEAEMYEVFPFLLPAAGVNAAHERYRIWFIAYSTGGRQSGIGRLYKESNHDDNNATIGSNLFGKIEGLCSERFVADTGSIGSVQGIPGKPSEQFNQIGKDWSVDKHTHGERCQKCDNAQLTTEPARFSCERPIESWHNWPTQSPVCDGNDGISGRLDFAAVFGSVKHPRQPARAFGKWRNESIKAGGNAIVPQVALQIFKAIEQYNLQCA